MSNVLRKTENKTIISLYHDDLKNCEPIRSKEREIGLIIKAKDGDIESRNELLKSNLRFVFNTARKYTGQGVPFEDLISEGNMALIYAIEKYDTDRDVRFITYASWWVRFFMSDLVKKTYGRHVTEKNEDLFVLKNKDISDINYEAVHDDDNTESHDKLLKKTHGKEELVNDLLSELSPRERDVLECYYGLNGKEELNLGDLAKRHGVSKERIRQIKLTGLSKMRSEVLLLDDFDNDLF